MCSRPGETPSYHSTSTTLLNNTTTAQARILRARSYVCENNDVQRKSKSTENPAHVHRLHLDRMSIKNTMDIIDFCNLRFLSLSNNEIEFIQDCEPLSLLIHLEVLVLDGNPVAELFTFRAHMVRIFSWPQSLSWAACRLRKLNDTSIEKREIEDSIIKLEEEKEHLAHVIENVYLEGLIALIKSRFMMHQELMREQGTRGCQRSFCTVIRMLIKVVWTHNVDMIPTMPIKKMEHLARVWVTQASLISVSENSRDSSGDLYEMAAKLLQQKIVTSLRSVSGSTETFPEEVDYAFHFLLNWLYKKGEVCSEEQKYLLEASSRSTTGVCSNEISGISHHHLRTTSEALDTSSDKILSKELLRTTRSSCRIKNPLSAWKTTSISRSQRYVLSDGPSSSTANNGVESGFGSEVQATEMASKGRNSFYEEVNKGRLLSGTLPSNSSTVKWQVKKLYFCQWRWRVHLLQLEMKCTCCLEEKLALFNQYWGRGAFRSSPPLSTHELKKHFFSEWKNNYKANKAAEFHCLSDSWNKWRNAFKICRQVDEIRQNAMLNQRLHCFGKWKARFVDERNVSGNCLYLKSSDAYRVYEDSSVDTSSSTRTEIAKKAHVSSAVSAHEDLQDKAVVNSKHPVIESILSRASSAATHLPCQSHLVENHPYNISDPCTQQHEVLSSKSRCDSAFQQYKSVSPDPRRDHGLNVKGQIGFISSSAGSKNEMFSKTSCICSSRNFFSSESFHPWMENSCSRTIRSSLPLTCETRDSVAAVDVPTVDLDTRVIIASLKGLNQRTQKRGSAVNRSNLDSSSYFLGEDKAVQWDGAMATPEITAQTEQVGMKLIPAQELESQVLRMSTELNHMKELYKNEMKARLLAEENNARLVAEQSNCSQDALQRSEQEVAYLRKVVTALKRERDAVLFPRFISAAKS